MTTFRQLLLLNLFTYLILNSSIVNCDAQTNQTTSKYTNSTTETTQTTTIANKFTFTAVNTTTPFPRPTGTSALTFAATLQYDYPSLFTDIDRLKYRESVANMSGVTYDQVAIGVVTQASRRVSDYLYGTQIEGTIHGYIPSRAMLGRSIFVPTTVSNVQPDGAVQLGSYNATGILNLLNSYLNQFGLQPALSCTVPQLVPENSVGVVRLFFLQLLLLTATLTARYVMMAP